jgi:hypothetical protein
VGDPRAGEIRPGVGRRAHSPERQAAKTVRA